MGTQKKEFRDDSDFTCKNFVPLLKNLFEANKAITESNARAAESNARAAEIERRNIERLKDLIGRQDYISFGLKVIHRKEKSTLSDRLMTSSTRLRLIS